MDRGFTARTAAGAAVIVLGMTGCAATGGSGEVGSTRDAVSVVASTTILGSVAGQVTACGGGEVQTLMPVGADPHDYAPSSADVAAMVEASLVITNGLGLEEGLASALGTAEEDGATVLEVGPAVDPQPLSGATGSTDPHVWLDVSRMATAATLIGDELATVTGDATYAACGAQVATTLTETDAQVRAILDAVPAASRVLVTDHDAFGYFSRAYDFTVIGVVIPGGSTLAQPSSSELAGLAETVRRAGVEAIFANTANSTALVDGLAHEVGTRVSVVELYVGSLGAAGSGADTYQTMMLADAHLIADALADQGSP
ncbi:metal ABC transporter substrate-binding protein [Actinotalea sp. K2]|uniref:metal ABC transporter substrate-binding protein n=1 Tax=Actinotalea sp. K2 TaxID=2939438 RepID=UPI0020170A8E|nr:metal ABC transporter substrate-binding protein [Actinotalea sp. K2]MCL3860071.1 metal ABC transporter substrate-binding protein [Actinotalea sp. K2]